MFKLKNENLSKRSQEQPDVWYYYWRSYVAVLEASIMTSLAFTITSTKALHKVVMANAARSSEIITNDANSCQGRQLLNEFQTVKLAHFH